MLELRRQMSVLLFKLEAKYWPSQGHKLLNYDLQILHDHLKTSNNKNIIVAFQDSEAFDSGVISDALILFQ